MINKPYSLLPSDLVDGRGVVDISKATEFSFLASGTSPIYMMAIEMCDLDGTPSSSIFIAPLSPIYYTTLDGDPKPIAFSLTSAQLNSIVGNASEQMYRIILWDASETAYATEHAQYQNGTTTVGEYTANYAVASDWVFVWLKSTPSASISTSETASSKSNTWTFSYTPSKAYENKQANGETTPVRYLRWRIYDTASAADPIYDSGEIYGCVEPSYTADGLRNGHSYIASVLVVDQSGIVTSVESIPVAVSYDQYTSGIMELKYSDEVQNYSAEFGVGHEIALDITRFAGERGESSLGAAGYDIFDLGSPIGYVLGNHDGNAISYSDISYDTNNDITVRFLFNPVSYQDAYDIAYLYVDENESARIRFALTFAGGIPPSNSLTPSDDLVPEVRNRFITVFYEKLLGGVWVVEDSSSTAIDTSSMDIDDFLYHEEHIDAEQVLALLG